MATLETRLARLEAAAKTVHLANLSDTELDAHILTLIVGSPCWYDAIVHRVMRYPSAFPVVYDDPDYLIARDRQA